MLNPKIVRGMSLHEEGRRTMPQDAWRDFQRRSVWGTVPRDLTTATPIDWLPKGTWNRGVFEAKHPGNAGYIELGPVGFSRDGRTAVLWVMWSGGPLSASGDYVLMERTAEGWRVARSVTVIQA